MADRIVLPDIAELVMAQIQPRIDRALEKASTQAQAIIRLHAIAENEDADGNPMPKKKPRPTKAPTNFPNTPLVQNETPDEMNPKRWRSERWSDTQVNVIYTPSDHHQYLEEQGRAWLTQEKVNPTAKAEIQQLLIEEFNR